MGITIKDLARRTLDCLSSNCLLSVMSKGARIINELECVIGMEHINNHPISKLLVWKMRNIAYDRDGSYLLIVQTVEGLALQSEAEGLNARKSNGSRDCDQSLRGETGGTDRSTSPVRIQDNQTMAKTH